MMATYFDDDDIISTDSCTWNGLPDVAIKKIFEKLKTGDRVRMRLVSKSWKRILTREDIPTAPESPWLIKSDDSYSESESFVTQICIQNTFEDRVYVFRLPELLYRGGGGGWFCGSSGGWLLIASSNADLFLWNPLSSATRRLPSLSTLPFFNKIFRDVGVIKMYFASFIKRVEVFSLGSSDQCIVAAIFSNCLGGEEHLAFCTPQEETWCVLQGDYNYLYEDILFHNGKLYALAHQLINREDGGNNVETSEANYSIRLPTLDCEVQVRVSCLVYKIDEDTNYNVDHHHELNNPTFKIKHGDYFIEHLVESSSTQLLVVTAIFDSYVYNSNGGGPVVAFECNQTKRFEVRKYPGLERVMGSLGGKQIFVGSTGSLCLPANVERLCPNHITFSTHDAVGMVGENNDNCVVAREFGRYNMELNVIMRRVAYLPSPVQSKTGWLTPKLF